MCAAQWSPSRDEASSHREKEPGIVGAWYCRRRLRRFAFKGWPMEHLEPAPPGTGVQSGLKQRALA